MPDATDAVAGFVAERTGLSLSTFQHTDLKRYLHTRFGASATAADCVHRLNDASEFRLLLDRLTVKETYFYRHETQFEALRGMLLPRFVEPARTEGRAARLWSAGCCTGEEPYTLAIIAAERGCLDDVEILGTDINEGYLETAIAGAYTHRAVRQLSPEIVAKYFVPEGDRLLVREEIRSRVSFKYLNLAEATYPSFLNGTSGVDVVFCRNVLIYFDKATVSAILARFSDCLQPDGLVAFGHSEMHGPEAPLVVEQVADAFLYGRRPQTVQPGDAPVIAPRRLESTAAPLLTRIKPTLPSKLAAQATPRASAAAVAESPAALVARAERLADSGKTAEAVETCRVALTRDPALVDAHYVLGLLELDTPDSAAAHFRRVLYLNPNHLTARLHLAQASEKLGTFDHAIREYMSLERLALMHPSDEVLDSREGITFGMVAVLSRAARERLTVVAEQRPKP